MLFVRKRRLQPQAFAEESHHALLQMELKNLSRAAAAHLEAEWEDYDRLYPRE